MSIIYINSYQFAEPTDPYFSNVALLLHGDGTNGSTTIIDNSPSPKTVTPVGGAQISTAQSKFGGASMYFGGNGDSISTLLDSRMDFGGADFTVEAWVYLQSATGFLTIFTIGWRYVEYGPFLIAANNGVVQIYLSTHSTSWNVASGANGGTLAINTWSHVCVCRQGSSTRIFLNGALQSMVSSSYAFQSFSGKKLVVGAGTDNANAWNGYIDDLRITKGVARYTSNFTPPTAPFPDA